MKDRRARAVTDTALFAIKSILDSSATPEDFLIGVDEILDDPSNILSLPVDLGLADSMHPAAGTQAVDIDNGPVVYEFLGSLDPANASDPRLWTYLAFSTYREYMVERWSLTAVRNWKGRVERRWLLRNASRGSLVRHGISRLWWVTSLTYDPGCKFPLAELEGDPFAYTRAAFRNEDRIIGLFDREAGSIGSLVRAVLEYAAISDVAISDNQIRTLMKEVTLVYGFRDIEVLSGQQVRELITNLALGEAIETAPILPVDHQEVRLERAL